MFTPMACRECWISAASIWPANRRKKRRKSQKSQSEHFEVIILFLLLLFQMCSVGCYRPSLFLSRLRNISLSSFSCVRRYWVNSSKSSTPSWLVSPASTSWKQRQSGQWKTNVWAFGVVQKTYNLSEAVNCNKSETQICLNRSVQRAAKPVYLTGGGTNDMF